MDTADPPDRPGYVSAALVATVSYVVAGIAAYGVFYRLDLHGGAFKAGFWLTLVLQLLLTGAFSALAARSLSVPARALWISVVAATLVFLLPTLLWVSSAGQCWGHHPAYPLNVGPLCG